MFDVMLDNFVITCKKCGSTNCVLDRDIECIVICLDCESTEWCGKED